jgi:putative DNA primase/helicase
MRTELKGVGCMNTRITLYIANHTGNARNTLYPHKVEVKDLDDFRRAMAYDHVCAEYNGCHRSVKDFISADCIMFDCDNDHSDNSSDWVLPENVQSAFPGVGFYFCYSRHHNRAKNGRNPRPKFHIYFAVDPIYDATEYASLKERVIEGFPALHLDTGAKDSARFFFGVNNPQVNYFEGVSHETK